MNIKTGDIVLQLDFDKDMLSKIAESVLSFFVTSEVAEFTVCVKSLENPKKLDYLIECKEGYTLIETPYFKTELNFKSNSGNMILFGEVNETVLLNAVKNLLVFYVLELGGIVLHASAIVKDNNAYVFAGPSGSGKSTLVDNAVDLDVLSEEVVAVLPGKQGYKAFALPYNGDQRLLHRTNKAYPLVGLHTLVHADEDNLISLSKAEFLAKAMIVPSGLEQKSSIDFLSRYANLVNKIDCYEFQFHKKSDLGSLIPSPSPKGEGSKGKNHGI